MKTDITTIIPNPTWGKVLELIQERGTLRISTSDVDTFKNLLNSINLKFEVEDDAKTELTRFTLTK